MVLTLNTSELGQCAVLHCSGRIVAGGATAALWEKARELLCRHRRLLLDLCLVEGVDAGGLGTLVQLHLWARTGGRELALLNPSPRVLEAMELVSVRGLFQIFYSHEGWAEWPLRTASGNAECG